MNVNNECHSFKQIISHPINRNDMKCFIFSLLQFSLFKKCFDQRIERVFICFMYLFILVGHNFVKLTMLNS